MKDKGEREGEEGESNEESVVMLRWMEGWMIERERKRKKERALREEGGISVLSSVQKEIFLSLSSFSFSSSFGWCRSY